MESLYVIVDRCCSGANCRTACQGPYPFLLLPVSRGGLMESWSLSWRTQPNPAPDPRPCLTLDPPPDLEPPQNPPDPGTPRPGPPPPQTPLTQTPDHVTGIT